MTPIELRNLSEERMGDARMLHRDQCFAGALYLAGYAIECALKARVCDHLAWSEFRMTGEYKIMKTHDFVFLRGFTGMETTLSSALHLPDWSIVTTWKPEMRYEATTLVTELEARDMLDSASRLIHIL